MNNNRLWVSLIAALLVVGATAGYLATGASPQLGLDLQGGISAIYSPVIEEGEERPEDFDGVLDETISIIRARVDSLGVAEPEISRQGDDVLVQLPGLDDAERAQEIIGQTAQLRFRRVEATIPPTAEQYNESPPCDEIEPLDENEAGVVCAPDSDTPEGEQPLKYQVSAAALTGDAVEAALAVFQNGWVVELDLTNEGGQQFAEVTAQLACERDTSGGLLGQLAIVLDGRVESAPSMNPGVACGEGITGGTAIITVGQGPEDEQQQEARDLALVLKTGALPITLEPSTFETVSPTLGEASLDAGLLAGIIGLILVAVYLIFWYRMLGVIAIGSLAIFGVIMLGVITAMGEVGFSLTLAGIAGIIVSIGITADSSILFFERLKDEVASGRTVRTASQKAFTGAFRTNLTGNTTTLAAAIILYFLAVGPVRGFAFTLGIATILDIVILYVYSRPAVILISQSRFIKRRSIRGAAAAEAGGAR